MTYIEAIELAKNKETEGYRFLYENTYRDKYYIALKYMQNEQDALDVLQDAYIKAFEKLDTLVEPDKFSGWLGMIVAHTAKNALIKKKPILFSEMGIEDEEGFFWETQIEDDKVESQPELSYTQEETKELVQELINSLSEEQKMCILMFYLEDMSIKEIAEILECSENTVKSRLNYGRKNLKAKAEELEKKGCKLYGMAPMPLLLYLVRAEGAAFLPEAEVAKLLKFQNFIEYFNAITEMMQQTGGQLAAEQAASGVGKLAKQTTGAAGKAAKQTFLHTVAGKLTVGVAAMLMITGVVATVIHNQPSVDEETAIVQNSDEDIEEASQNEEMEQDVTEETTEENTEYMQSAQAWKDAYIEVLEDTVTWLRDTQNVDADLLEELSDYEYTLFDLNQDETPELIIHAGIPASSVYCFFCTYSQEKGAYMVSNLTRNFRHSLVVCDGQLSWYYYIPLGYAGEETRLTGGIEKFEMTPDEVTCVSIYSGVMEDAPETQDIELYSIEDTKAIEDY